MTVIVIFFKSVVYARFRTFAARFFIQGLINDTGSVCRRRGRRLVKAVMRCRPDAPLHKHRENMRLIMSDRPLNITLRGAETRYFDLSSLRIAPCMGCFRCWTKTPGQCVIRDDATTVYPCIAQSDRVIYVSRLRYGGYDSVMKTMLERAIPIQQAFIRIHKGETHHVQRAVRPKKATIVAYGDTGEEERDLFRRLVARNATNMSFEHYDIIFTTEAMVDDVVNKILEIWEES